MNKLSIIHSFFTERRFVYGNETPDRQAGVKAEKPKLPRIYTGGDKVSDFMLAEAKKAADEMFKSPLFDAVRFPEKTKEPYKQVLRTLISDKYTKNLSDLGIIVNSVPRLKQSAPKFDSANQNRDEAQRELDEARVAFIMSHFNEYKDSIDTYKDTDPKFTANLNIRKKPTGYEEVLKSVEQIKLTNEKERNMAIQTLTEALLDEGSAENKNKGLRSLAEIEVKFALKELPDYEQFLSAIYLFAQQNRTKDIKKIADDVADKLVEHAEKTENLALSKRLEEILYEDGRKEEPVNMEALASKITENEPPANNPVTDQPSVKKTAAKRMYKKVARQTIRPKVVAKATPRAKNKPKTEPAKPSGNETVRIVTEDTKKSVAEKPKAKKKPPAEKSDTDATGRAQRAAEIAEMKKPSEPKITISETAAKRLSEYGVQLLGNGHNAKGEILRVYSALKNAADKMPAANLLFSLARSEEKNGYYESAATLYDRLYKDFRGDYNPRDKKFHGGTDWPVMLDTSIANQYSIGELNIKSRQCYFLSEMQSRLKKRPGEIINPHDPDEVADFFDAEKNYGAANLQTLLSSYLTYFFAHTGRDLRVDASNIQPDNKLGRKKVDCKIFADIARDALKDSISGFRYILCGNKEGDKIVGAHTMALITLKSGDRFIVNNNIIWSVPAGTGNTDNNLAKFATLQMEKLSPTSVPEKIKILGNKEDPQKADSGVYAGNFDSGTIYSTKSYLAKKQPTAEEPPITLVQRPKIGQ